MTARAHNLTRLSQSGGMQQPVTVRTATTLLAVDLMRLAVVPMAAAYVVVDVRRSALIGGRARWGGGQPEDSDAL